MERRMVRPRVWVDGQGHPLLLTDAVNLCPRLGEPGTLIEIRGGPGSGKTCALKIAFSALGRYNVRPLDGPSSDQLAQALARGSAIVTGAAPGFPVTLSLTLCPWSDDELIEYCLANHREACASIMPRVLAMRDRHRLEGAPGLWAPVLDLMSHDPQLETLDAVISSLVQQHASGPELGHLWSAAWTISYAKGTRLEGLSRAVRGLLRHTCVRLHLQARHLLHSVVQGHLGILHGFVPTEDLASAAAPLLAVLPSAVEALHGAADGKKKAAHAAAATLLIARFYGSRRRQPAAVQVIR
jgi:hypothetical protein